MHPGLSNTITKETESKGKEKGTSTKPDSQTEDQVTVTHGSSAQDTEHSTQSEHKHIIKTKLGDDTLKSNPADSDDMEIVIDQDKDKIKDFRSL